MPLLCRSGPRQGEGIADRFFKGTGTENGDASILNDLADCDDSTTHATADCALVRIVSAGKLAAEMSFPVSLPVGW